MKPLLLALALLPSAAQARTLLFTCTLTERVGGPENRAFGSVGWSFNTGFESPGGLITLSTNGLAAEVNVIRDSAHSSGFFYRLHLLDESSGKTIDQEFLGTTTLRPRPEGSVSVDCVVDA